jgi:hypothetical protein
MASEKEINEIEENIFKNCLHNEFLKDLFNWARDKYSRTSSNSSLLNKVHSRNLYKKFLHNVIRNKWHLTEDGVYNIINYLSHGEQAPMPVHIRMILDSNKKVAKNYIKKIKFIHE